MGKLLKTTIISLFIYSLNGQAAVIEKLSFNQNTKNLRIEVSYTGGCENHGFTLSWDQCQINPTNDKQEIAARLIDSGWQDTCNSSFYEAIYINLSELKCNPSKITIFGDGKQHKTIEIDK